jgi:hypothetical protein
MRRKIAYLTIAGLLGIALVDLGTAGVAVADTPQRAAAGPIGVWTGTVSFPAGQVEAKMSFLPNGTVCLVPPPPGPAGGVEGKGTWKRTDANTFTFLVTERFFDGAGTTTGYLRANHAATQQRNDFTSSGKATYYDASWVQLNTVPATSHMRRENVNPVSC